jgi:hypothetical protein
VLSRPPLTYHLSSLLTTQRKNKKENTSTHNTEMKQRPENRRETFLKMPHHGEIFRNDFFFIAWFASAATKSTNKQQHQRALQQGSRACRRWRPLATHSSSEEVWQCSRDRDNAVLTCFCFSFLLACYCCPLSLPLTTPSLSICMCVFVCRSPCIHCCFPLFIRKQKTRTHTRTVCINLLSSFFSFYTHVTLSSTADIFCADGIHRYTFYVNG